MKKALVFLALLAASLLVALVVRVAHLRSAGHGPPGGTAVVEGLDVDVTSRLATRITKVLVREGHGAVGAVRAYSRRERRRAAP